MADLILLVLMFPHLRVFYFPLFSIYRLNRIFWGSELTEKIPTANFNDLITDDVALLTWLQQLEVFGFVLIQNAPVEHGQIKKLADRVSFIRKTHYG